MGNFRIALGACVLLTGCSQALTQMDPFERPYVWHPIGANQANLAAMVVNPHDLAGGRRDPRADSAPAILGIERVRTDQTKPLKSAMSGSDSSGGGNGTGAGATSAGN